VTVIQHRSELRDVTVKGRLIDMIAVPYDTPAWVVSDAGPYRESFAPGAFAKFERPELFHRIHLRYEHTPGIPYGRATDLRSDGKYLRATMKVTFGDSADRLLAQAADGDIAGVSVGFVPGVDRDDTDDHGPLVRRVKVKHLEEISLTESPVYADAKVLATRAAAEQARAEATQWVTDFRRTL
jgi:HK97 family phage prohead protease